MNRILKGLLAVLMLGTILLVATPRAEARRWVYVNYGYCVPPPVYRVYYPRRVVYRACYPPYYAAPVYPYPAPVYYYGY
jgi:hypothetical protein